MDGLLHGVLGLPRNARLNVVGVQVALQEEVQAAVGQQERIVEDPVSGERERSRANGPAPPQGRRESSASQAGHRSQPDVANVASMTLSAHERDGSICYLRFNYLGI